MRLLSGLRILGCIWLCDRTDLHTQKRMCGRLRALPTWTSLPCSSRTAIPPMVCMSVCACLAASVCVCVCVSARCVSLHLVCVSDASFTSYCPRRQSYTKLHTMCTVVAKKRRATTIHRDMHKIVRMDVHADMHACMYAYISAYRPLHAYIYTPTQHACTHTHTHTHRYVFAVYIVSHAVSLV